MRIVFLTHEFLTENRTKHGGVGEAFYKYAQLFSSHGHRVSIVVTSDDVGEFDFRGIDIYRVVWPKWFHVINFLFYKKFDYLLRTLIGSFILNRQARLLSPDFIIHSSYFHTGFFHPRSIKGFIRVATYQTFCDFEFGVSKWSLRFCQVRLIDWLMFRSHLKVVFPSRFIADWIAKDFKREVVVIPTPIPQLDFDHLPQLQNKLIDKKYFVFASRIGRQKGAQDLSLILTDLLNSDPDLYFVFAGVCENETREMIMNNNKAVSSRILFLGRLDKLELWSVIKHALALCLPSRIDNLPNVGLEALALGQLIVGTRGASIDELVDDNKNGFLFAPNSPKEMLESHLKILKLTPEERNRFVEAAHLKARYFDSERVLQMFLQIINEVGTSKEV